MEGKSGGSANALIFTLASARAFSLSYTHRDTIEYISVDCYYSE